MRRVSWLLGGVACTLGCSLSVEVLRSESANTEPRPPDCVVRYFRDALGGAGQSCERIAQLRIRDTGFTTDCDSNALREAIRGATCEAGGDTAVLHRVRSTASTCVQEDADIYRCRSTGSDGTPGVPAAPAGE